MKHKMVITINYDDDVYLKFNLSSQEDPNEFDIPDKMETVIKLLENSMMKFKLDNVIADSHKNKKYRKEVINDSGK